MLHTETCINETMFFEKFYAAIQANDARYDFTRELKLGRSNDAPDFGWNSLPTKPEMAHQKSLFYPVDSQPVEKKKLERNGSIEKSVSQIDYKSQISNPTSCPTFQPRRCLYNSYSQESSVRSLGVTLKDLRSLLAQRVEKEGKNKKKRFKL